MAVFIAPFYAEQMGMGAALTGLIFMCLRFWDMVTDPITGWLVDTRTTPWGRIKPWLVAAIPVLGTAAFFVYNPGRTARKCRCADHMAEHLLFGHHHAHHPASCLGADHLKRL